VSFRSLFLLGLIAAISRPLYSQQFTARVADGTIMMLSDGRWAVLRIEGGAVVVSGVVKGEGNNGLFLDQDHRTWRLSRTEYELLAHLVRRRGQPVARMELLKEVWRCAPDTSSRTVDRHIAQLRRKLDEAARHVVTVHGRGYAFRI